MKFASGVVVSSCIAASSTVYLCLSLALGSWCVCFLVVFLSGCSDLVCFNMRSEPDIEGFDGLFQALAVPADDCSVEHGGGFGDVGYVFPMVELGKVFLRWELHGCHHGIDPVEGEKCRLIELVIDMPASRPRAAELE